jgi:hypothetical protein
MRLVKKKKKFDFALEEYFWWLSKNQKLAIIHFLSVIAVSDMGPKTNNDEGDLINMCYKKFRVSGDEVLEYTAMGGREQTAKDILKMKRDNLFGLIMLNYKLCELNGGPSNEQFEALMLWLVDLNITVNEWYDMDV